MPRPTKYTKELGLVICARLFDGRSLRAICREDADMPSASTVHLWLGRYPEFADSYLRVKEIAQEMLADDILDIADDSSKDFYIDKDGQRKANSTKLARDRMRIEARRWHVMRMANKKYQRDRTEAFSRCGEEKPAKATSTQFMAELDAAHIKHPSPGTVQMASKASKQDIADDGRDLC